MAAEVKMSIRYCPVCGIATAVETCTGAALNEPHESVPTIHAPLGTWEPPAEAEP